MKDQLDVTCYFTYYALNMFRTLIYPSSGAHNKWNKIASDIKLGFHSSTITMMHGPINISTVLCPVVDFCVLNCLTEFQFRNSLYYSLISKWSLPFRLSCLILFKHFSFPLWILLLRNPWLIIECQKMDKFTVLLNTTSFNLVDMNLSDYTMSYARRLESEYTHTNTQTHC